MSVEAVIFDFIGTLTNLVGYSLEESEAKMLQRLQAQGYDVSHERFFEAYRQAHDKFREIRYRELVEVANTVWVSEALNLLGYATTPKDAAVKTAVTVFFEDYVEGLRLRSYAKSTLRRLCSDYKLGLVSNFTYAPVIYAALRKLKIDGFFATIVVSEEVGWRKPSPKIFSEALRRLSVEPSKAVYVGDTPLEDILGAGSLGMKTIFIPSQFKTREEMDNASRSPDHYITKLREIVDILSEKQDT